MVHPEISRRNIIPEGAYLQKHDFKRKAAAQTVMRITGGRSSVAFLAYVELVREITALWDKGGITRQGHSHY
jgi:hypothetical protein